MHMRLNEAWHKGMALKVDYMSRFPGVSFEDIGRFSNSEDIAVSNGERRNLRLFVVDGNNRSAMEDRVGDIRRRFGSASTHCN